MHKLLFTVSPGFKIAYLFLFMLIGFIIAGVFTSFILMILGFSELGSKPVIYISIIMQSVLAIALPAYLAVAFTNSKPVNYLKIGKDTKSYSKVIFATLVFIISYLYATFLTQLNKEMVLPESLKGIEELMRSLEDSALETTNLLLSGKTLGSLILNLTVVAGLAAISEELFFRGALQQFIYEKLKKKHIAVWLTALVFSLVHFQFFGFLPRLFLGAVLGYLFLYTKNLWAPILFHFLNNGTVIILNYFWSEKEWYSIIENTPITNTLICLSLVSLTFTIILFWVYNRQTLKKYI